MDAAATLRPLTGTRRRCERLVERLARCRLADATDGPDVGVHAGSRRTSPSRRTRSGRPPAATLARLGGPGQWVLALPAHYVAGLQVVVRSVLAGTSPGRAVRPRRPRGGCACPDPPAPLPRPGADAAPPDARATQRRGGRPCHFRRGPARRGGRDANPAGAGPRARRRRRDDVRDERDVRWLCLRRPAARRCVSPAGRGRSGHRVGAGALRRVRRPAGAHRRGAA